jgi:hypothetical protein
MKPMPGRRVAEAVATGVAVLAVAAFGTASAYGSARSSGHSPHHAHGLVKGKLVREDGPTPPGGKPPETPVPGLIRFTAVNRHLVVKVRVGHHGKFMTKLPSGRYQVVGRSPGLEMNGPGEHEAWCSLPLTVIVHPHRTAKITVVCPAP